MQQNYDFLRQNGNNGGGLWGDRSMDGQTYW